LRQACLKSGIVIAEQPDLRSDPTRQGYFAQAFLADLKLFFYGWAAFPPDGGMAADAGTVDSIAVTDDRNWIEPLAELDKRAMGS
jgi:hypothetical protein